MNCDIQTEQALIGGVLMTNELFHRVQNLVEAADFSEELHQRIWEALATLIGMGKMANVLTVRPSLGDMDVGGVTLQVYLARLAGASCLPSEAPHLAAMVRDLAHRRAIAAVGEQLAKVSAPNPSELAEWGVTELDRIVTCRSAKMTPAMSVGDSGVRALDGIASAYQANGAIIGIPYGLPDLDAKTSGLQRGELTILAGRPGQGKSLVALNFARRMSEAGYRGMFFSLEMKDVAMTRRIFSDLIYEQREVAYSRMRSGRVSEKEFMLIRDAAETVKGWPLHIEQDDVSASQILSRARQRKAKHGLDYIIVDHLGHVQASDRYSGNKNSEIAEITGSLMRGARELDIGVIALCQLSRTVEGRDNKRPTLSDLRDSGAIEQDAATVLFLYREAYYLQNQEPKVGTPEYDLWQDKMTACINNLDILISKQRDGGTGSVQAYVDVTCNAVRPKGWAREWYQPENQEMAF
jgi:replicative DNA helicase